MKTTIKKDKRIFESQLQKCLQDMSQIRKEINESLDSIENILSEEIQHVDERMTKDTEGHIALFDDILSQIIEQLKKLKESEKAQDDQIMFVEIKKANTAQHKYVDTMAKMRHYLNQPEILFKINDTLYETVKQLQSVETVLVVRHGIRADITYGRPSQKSLLNMSISGRREIDFGNEDVFRCTFMPDGHLVLCCGDRGLFIFDKDFKIKSELFGYAWGVAAINDNEISVTQGGGEQIQKVKLFPEMKVSKTIKMDRYCFDVDVYGDEIYLVCCDGDGGNGEVQLLNMDGKVQRTLGLNNGKYRYTWPQYLTINNDGSKVFVSDVATDTVTCLDTQGHVIYQYSDPEFNYPKGMCVDLGGNLLVCGYSSNNIHVIGQDGRKVKSLLSEAEGVMHPWCIAFRKSDGCLVLGMDNNNNKKSLISYTAK